MTCSRLLVAALLVPTLSLAQEAAPPAPPALQPPPPAYQAAPVNQPGPVYPAQPVYPAPPPPATPRLHLRDSWYIGFGLGTGGGDVSGQSQTLTFKDMNAGRSPTNALLNFKVGATLTPKLLLGFDVTAIRSAATDNGYTTAVQVTNYDVMLTWFPYETGLFLRGGVGLSALSWELDTLGTSTYRGANLLVGVGYAFWIGQHFNLTANLDYSGQSYGSSTDAPERSKFWALWLGFDWY
jgi:hypothetical protein